MRLVDADKQVERLKSNYCEDCTKKGDYGIFGCACTPCWVKDAVEEFENADTFSAECDGRLVDAKLAHEMLMQGYDLRDVPSVVHERMRGRWMRTGASNVFGGIEVECSECHNRVVLSPERYKNRYECEKYCCVCGACMDAKED